MAEMQPPDDGWIDAWEQVPADVYPVIVWLVHATGDAVEQGAPGVALYEHGNNAWACEKDLQVWFWRPFPPPPTRMPASMAWSPF